MFETILIFLGIYSGVPCLILTELLLDTAVAATSHPSTAREKIIAKHFYVLFLSLSSLGRYVFGSEISYNKAPPRLPGLAY